jgi:hypothetical protein
MGLVGTPLVESPVIRMLLDNGAKFPGSGAIIVSY